MSSDYVLEHLDPLSISVGERFRKDYGDVEELASSIAGPEGLLNPLCVKDNGDSSYTLAAGGRRYQAITSILKWETVPCRVFPPDTDEFTIRTIELVENIQRKDMTWDEEAKLTAECHRLHVEKYGEKISRSADAEGHSIRDTAKILKKSHTQVAADIQLADAIEHVPELKNCRNKNEAVKTYKKVEEAILEEELAKRARKRVEESGNDERKLLSDAYIVGDFFKAAASIPNETFDIIEIDPPYGVDYKRRRKDGAVSIISDTGAYNEIPADEYREFLDRTMQEAYRVAKADAWVIVWHAQDPWAEEVYQSITAAGFTCSRRPAVWAKPSGICPAPSKQLASTFEVFYYGRKGDPGIIKEGRSAVYDYGVGGNKRHPTERPIELMQDVLGTFGRANSTVLVPFAGSGNTLIAAHKKQMACVGYDLSQEYKNSYDVALEDHV